MPVRGGKRKELNAVDLLKIYNNQFNNIEIFSQELIWKLLHNIVGALGQPFEKAEHQAGPKFTYAPNFYACAFLFKVYFNLTYREAAVQINLVNGSCADFRSLSWAVRKRLPPEYIARAVKMLAVRIRKILYGAIRPERELIAGDSTGLSHSTKDGHFKIHDSAGIRQKIRVGGHTKLYVNLAYAILARQIGAVYKERIVSTGELDYKVKDRVRRNVLRGIVWIESISVGKAYTHDGKLFREAFNSVQFRGKKFLLDAAFDDEENVLRLLHSNGCSPQVKLKQIPIRSNMRKWVEREFKKQIYRFRGVIEARFGGIKARTRKLRNRDYKAQMCEVAAIALGTQIRTYLRLAFATGLRRSEILRFLFFVIFATESRIVLALQPIRQFFVRLRGFVPPWLVHEELLDSLENI